MPDPRLARRKSLFSAVACFCALVSALLLRFVNTQVGQGGNLVGYSSFSIMVSFLAVFALTGLVTGQIGLIRGEKPLVIPVLALLLNGVIFVTAILIVPR
jgi:hypothetical protein